MIIVARQSLSVLGCLVLMRRLTRRIVVSLEKPSNCITCWSIWLYINTPRLEVHGILNIRSSGITAYPKTLILILQGLWLYRRFVASFTLLRRRSCQRRCLYALDLSICSLVCLSVCLSPKCIHRNAIFSKTKHIRVMVSIDDDL